MAQAAWSASGDALRGTGCRTRLRLGSGGTGEVFLAEQGALGVQVVVKLLHRDLSDSPQQLGRALGALRSLNRLGRRELPRVTDLRSTPHGRIAVVMERAGGVPLHRLPKRAWGVQNGARLFARLCAAVGAAHAVGVPHGDLRPGHLLVSGDGLRATPRVVDFMSSRLLSAVQIVSGNGTAPAPGEGAAWFLAPERWDGEPVSTRADVYALGLLAYQALGLPHPLAHLAGVALYRAHRSGGALRPRALCAALSPAMEQVLLKASAPDPLDRYPDASVMARAWTAAATVTARASSHFAVGALLEAHGRTVTARRHYEKACALDPANPVIQARLWQLRVP